MTSAEHQILGQILLAVGVLFFALALPISVFLQRKNSRGELPSAPIPPDEIPGENSDLPDSSPYASPRNSPPPLPAAEKAPSPISRYDLILVGLYYLLFVFAWIGTSVGEKPPELSAPAIITSAIIMTVLGLLVPLMMFWRVDLIDFFGLRWKGWLHVLWIAPALFVAVMTFNALLLSFGWQAWIEANFSGESQLAVTQLRETDDLSILVSLAISAVIVAPIVEEVIFRGYLYPVAKKFTGIGIATLFSGLLFGVIHYNFLGLPILAVMGVALAIIYEKTGSLWAPIACHACFNGVSVGLIILSRYIDLPQPS